MRTIHTLMYPVFDPSVMRNVHVSILIITPEEFDILHRMVMDNGKIRMHDDGDCESGPMPSYEGHRWGGITAWRDDKTTIMSNNDYVTTGRGLREVIHNIKNW